MKRQTGKGAANYSRLNRLTERESEREFQSKQRKAKREMKKFMTKTKTTIAGERTQKLLKPNGLDGRGLVSTAQAPTIQIDPIPAATIKVPIIGTTPIITHRFSEKAKLEMLNKMQGKRTPKMPKDPQAEYEAAFYKFKNGGYGMPVIAFKAATVGAARFYGKDVTMTSLRQFMFFKGEIGVDGQQLARIIGEPRMREDVVRVGNGGTDLRYRPEFVQWSTILEITFVDSVLTQSSVLSLVDAGGMGVGVGEWRPEKRGEFGCYKIDTTKQIEVIS